MVAKILKKGPKAEIVDTTDFSLPGAEFPTKTVAQFFADHPKLALIRQKIEKKSLN